MVKDSRIIAQLALGMFIALAAVLIGKYALEYKRLDQTVTVKGLAEQIVKANEGSLIIEFQVEDGDLATLNAKAMSSRKAIEEFLLAQGFEQDKMQRQPISISKPNTYENNRVKETRYLANGSIQISSTDVDKVTKSSESTDALLEKGVFVTRTSVNYYYTALNDIKPAMLEEAAKNAREAAGRFAANSQVKVGTIKKADQGPFSITAPFSEWGGETTSLMKRIRVVTSVEYFLER